MIHELSEVVYLGMTMFIVFILLRNGFFVVKCSKKVGKVKKIFTDTIFLRIKNRLNTYFNNSI